MLIFNQKKLTFFQKRTCWKQIIIIVSLSLLKYTDKHCLKSLQKQTILSLKKTISSTSQKSKKIQLTVSILYFRCIKISFQKISFIFFINVARSVFLLISQMFWLLKSKNILNRTYTVWLSLKKIATMSKKVIVKTIFCCDCKLLITMFWTKVFFVSFESFKKNMLLKSNLLFLIALIIISTT